MTGTKSMNRKEGVQEKRDLGHSHAQRGDPLSVVKGGG